MAIFNDAGGYTLHDNLICGNQSAEYGGGMSQYGLSIAPLNVTGTLASSGSTDVHRRPAAPPSPPVMSGRPVAGFGLTGATIAAVDAPERSAQTTPGQPRGSDTPATGGLLSYQYIAERTGRRHRPAT